MNYDIRSRIITATTAGDHIIGTQIHQTPSFCCARGRPIIVEWERDARHSAGLSLVRITIESYLLISRRARARLAGVDVFARAPDVSVKFQHKLIKNLVNFLPRFAATREAGVGAVAEGLAVV
ncbi:hypothetical protein EVAR_25162_1 [Eumeta japonica]|uniref:Uncharacterized protein n=1 Tax=Eumeta variegata TaxID=151549 RepID=A0A4C1VU12_EUMVA|nr:hypothetical protein EVAR_25162_1 [Eumeta japonica]